ncbi:Hsp20/alpha crystallin family protein, partial [Verrucomicrobia bacterium]|nr:Hsp20/alpha crystallin family protein [Verrucomicrobiota bacterium]
MSKISSWQPFRRCLDHTDPFQDLDNLKGHRCQRDHPNWIPNELNSNTQPQVEWVPESRFDDYHQGYIIEIEIPSVPKEHIHIGVCHKTINLRVTEMLSGSEKISERGNAPEERKINLPDDADPREIIATFREGFIRLAIGRKTRKHTRNINL